jgi:NADH-quinone oxidoreductase subunit N
MLTNIYYLLPELFLGSISIVIIGIGCFLTKLEGKISQVKKLNYLTAVTFMFTAIMLLNLNTDHNVLICNDLLISNNNLVVIKIILLISSSIVIVLPNNLYDYEFSQLILLATLGMMLLISSNDLISLYLSIELISLSLYILATIRRNSQHSTEAGLKYFLLGALTSGLLLFGMGLLYTFTGETNLINLENII